MQITNVVLISLREFFAALPSWFRTTYLWVLLLVPIIYGLVVHQLADANVFGWHDARICKAQMEIIHPVLLAIGAFLGFVGYAAKRDPSLMFLGTMLAFTLAREIGGQGTSIILYAGLVGLITYHHSNPKKTVTLLESRLASSLMATGFICYAVSQFFDRGVIKRVGSLFTWDRSWKPAYSTQIEESLETLGGGFLLVTVLVTLILAACATPRRVETKL